MGFDLNYFFKMLPVIGKALPITLSVGITSMILGLLLGTLITFLRQSTFAPVRYFFEAYVSFFRGTPLMVQLFIFFFGLPQLLPGLANLNAFSAAIIVMSINGQHVYKLDSRYSDNFYDRAERYYGCFKNECSGILQVS